MPTPQRLPIVNSDDGTWGDILRQYLMKEHFNDDTDNAVNGGHKTVTIQPGTASAGTAPLKFTSGTLLTTPEAGAMEFAGDNYYLTQTSGTTRKKVAMYDDSSGATGDIYYRDASGYFTRLGIGSANNVLTVSGGVPSWQPSQGSTVMSDAAFTLQDNVDATKQLQFQLSGITTGTTRTLTVPDVSSTIEVTANKNAANGYIGADSAGKLPLSSINATGTADGTTYLRGDGTWSTPSGVGGSGGAYYAQTIGDGTTTSFTIVHSLNTRDVVINVYDTSTYEVVNVDKFVTNSTTVTLTFQTAPTTNEYRVVVVGAVSPGGGDASTNTTTSTANQVALFADTGGKTLAPATGTGIAKLASGVLSTVAAPTGAIVGDTDTQTLTNKTISGSSNTLSNIGLSSLATTGTASSSTYLRGDGAWTGLNAVYTANVGDGSSTSYVITHNLGTRSVAISVYDASTYKEVNVDKYRTTTNSVTLTFGTAPALNAYVCVITNGSISTTLNSTDIGDSTATGRSLLTATDATAARTAISAISATSTDTLQNKTIDNTNTVAVKDANWTMQDDGDTTKQLKFQLSGITTGNTRTLTIPDASTTLVGTDATQTLTNKTISGSSNTISNIPTSALPYSGAATAYVTTLESTSSGTYVDLTTTTDQVTVTIGSSGMALVTLYAHISGSVTSLQCYMGFALSGANTQSPSDSMTIGYQTSASSATYVGATFLLTGLAAGSTTVKAKYRTSTGGTGYFSERRIAVVPL